jgi:rifampicin phosphotransferase
MQYVMGLDELDEKHRSVVGGKAANLAELRRLDGVEVPDGCCVTTHAFDRIVADARWLRGPLERLSRLRPEDADAIKEVSAEIRGLLEAAAVPDDLVKDIARFLHRLGEDAPYAVRSSATAEDLPTASFAGQHDSYLDVVGLQEILRHVRRCWASLFTERAILYRLRNGFDHRRVRMAVIVQRMVPARAAGVMFTADPVTSNRRVVSIEAVFGLGEALVSGVENADVYRVRDGEVATRAIATKEGGEQPVLTDAEVLRLAQLGRRIEAHFGSPQDIEWCLADGILVVQSRPITTLFPVPDVTDGDYHVYLSVGHAQMMTDAMKPLGLSFWQLTTPRPMAEAGGRLFALATPAGRAFLLGNSDPLTRDALQTVLDRNVIAPLPDVPPGTPAPTGGTSVTEVEPTLVPELIGQSEASIAALKRDIAAKSGTEMFDVIRDDLQELKRISLGPESHQVIMAGMDGVRWLNDHLHEWLGQRNAADALTQSVPHNVTSEMGLALLDLADAVRPYPEVIAFLERFEVEGPDRSGFLDDLVDLPGGRAVQDAMRAYLDRYGMRGPGEIDITRPRWSERPAALVPIILSNVRNVPPGAAERRFEQGLRQAQETERELLERLRALPDGERKAQETKRMIDRVRAVAGYREYPKYAMVSRYFVYKQALLEEAERLVRAGTLPAVEDVFYLRFEEFREVVRKQQVDRAVVAARKEAFRSYQALTPPRVLTSDGEVINGSYRRADLPAGALAGLAVSAGTVEGRARVVVDMERANLAAGDILVTAHTDPSWTPLFLTIAGLVTEVGGLMTHGAVIAREYGLPAVVGVEQATRLIRDGQRIRVHGSEGYVEILAWTDRQTGVTTETIPDGAQSRDRSQ